jgi:phytoene desaturase
VPPAGAAQHNVHFGWAWDEAFAALADGARMPDPSTLVTVGSHGDPTAAPTGSSTLFAFEPVPNLDGAIDWTSDGGRIVDDLRARVGRLGYPIDDVVVERSIDPLIWRTMGLERGTPFSLAHTFRQTGPLRPRNVDDRVPGLAFAGAGTVPGVGVPMVMLSGKLAAQRIDTYAAATRTVRW